MELDEPGSAAARITFAEFRASDAPMLLAWGRFRDALIGRRGAVEVVAPSAASESGLWRLLATNNRELGRSFLLYRRFEAARAHVKHLQAQADSFVIEYVPGPNKSSRGWVVVAADGPVMTCSRWYGSLAAAAVAASRAVEVFESAVLAESVDRSDASGRFRRRTPASADVAP